MTQLRDLLRIIHTAFISEERQKLRNALKFWCKKHQGCVMLYPHDSKFPWIDFTATQYCQEDKAGVPRQCL